MTVFAQKYGEVVSHYGYHSGYMKPKGVTEQCDILRKIFPELGTCREELIEGPMIDNSSVPCGAEGWFAVPQWQILFPTYNEAVVRILDIVKQTRNGKFYNHQEGSIRRPEYLRQKVRTAKFFQALSDEQRNHDILLLPAQFGLLYRGRSVRRAREVMQTNEFGLGVFAVGIMLLTHPERLMDYDDLYIDCAGDESNDLDWTSSDWLDRVPCFDFGLKNRVEFGTIRPDEIYDHHGSASGFLPTL